MRRKIIIILLCVLLLWEFFHAPADKSPEPDYVTPTSVPKISKINSDLPISKRSSPPEVSAQNIFIIDQKSQSVLFSKDADSRIYPASTTKMMTAIVAKDSFSPDALLTVSKSYPEGQDIGLVSGEKVSLDNMLYALLVLSANDAAEVLAENYPGGRLVFIDQMNIKADKLHLQNTHFQNPTGFDEDGHYSSASDLARIAASLMSDDYLRRIVSAENAVIASADQAVVYPISNVNQLLGKVPGVLGVKTGWTDLAGESLVTLINRDGHEVIISLMGSSDRFSDNTKLIDWIYSNFVWNK